MVDKDDAKMIELRSELRRLRRQVPAAKKAGNEGALTLLIKKIGQTEAAIRRAGGTP